MIDFLTKPVPNTEAAEFIRSKPIVSRQVYDQMLPEVQALAFTISGVERYDVLQRVRDLTAELPQGGDWRKLKKEIAAELSPFLGEGKAANARAELILRHHGLQSYRVSQWQQVQRNKDVFPYLKYLSTRDGRTRASHSALHGIILPVDDPWWQTHMPPWEWGCRCQAIQVSQAQHDAETEAEKDKPLDERRVLGQAARDRLNNEGRLQLATRDPATGRLGPPQNFDLRTPAQKGNRGPGTVEDLRIPVEALRDRYDPDIWSEFEGWAKKTDVPMMQRSVWDWLDGGSGRSVGGGGAATGGLLASGAALQPAELVTALGSAASRETAHSLLELPEARRGTLSHGATKDASVFDAGFDFVNKLASGTVAADKVGIRRQAARAYAAVDGSFIDMAVADAASVVHELGHIIEQRNPGILKASIAFRAGRTQGDRPLWLGPGFDPDELALEDAWVKRGGSLYTGKLYRDPKTGKDYGSEILSSGLERLLRDPIGFAKEDPEHLQFILEAIRP